MINIDIIRKDTPACQDKLFFNSAGSSLPPRCVGEMIRKYLDEEERIGGYRLADLQEREIRGFYEEAAGLLNTEARHIAFANHATDAYTKALSSVPFAAGDVILTTDDDYVSNYLNFLSLRQRFGIRIVRARNLDNGDLDLGHFRQMIKQHHPRLVAVTHIPTSSGLVQDAPAVGELCRESGSLYLLDACQSVGQIPVDVQQIGCDFLSATGRKFLRGPRGTGFLYVSERVLQEKYAPLFVDLRGARWMSGDDYDLVSHAQRFEAWEVPYALLLGLREALAYARQVGIEQIEVYNQQFVSAMGEQLSALPGVQLFDRGSHRAAILTFRKEGRSLEATQSYLDQHEVYHSVVQKTSAQFDFEKKGIDWAIRLSPHYFNTLQEIEKLSEVVSGL